MTIQSSEASDLASVNRSVFMPALSICKLDKKQQCYRRIGTGNVVSGSFLNHAKVDALFILTVAHLFTQSNEDVYGLFDGGELWARFNAVNDSGEGPDLKLIPIGKVVEQGLLFFSLKESESA